MASATVASSRRRTPAAVPAPHSRPSPRPPAEFQAGAVGTSGCEGVGDDGDAAMAAAWRQKLRRRLSMAAAMIAARHVRRGGDKGGGGESAGEGGTAGGRPATRATGLATVGARLTLFLANRPALTLFTRSRRFRRYLQRQEVVAAGPFVRAPWARCVRLFQEIYLREYVRETSTRELG